MIYRGKTNNYKNNFQKVLLMSIDSIMVRGDYFLFNSVFIYKNNQNKICKMQKIKSKPVLIDQF